MQSVRRLTCLIVLLSIPVFLNLPVAPALRIKVAVRDACSPFLGTVAQLAEQVRGAVAFLKENMGTRAEQKALLQELTDLRLRVIRARLLEEENNELRRLIGFKERSNYRLIMCEVIARGDVSGWWRTITLNRGARDGVGPDMAVVTPDGLVGCVTTVAEHTAEALLISDPECRVAVRLAGRNAYGILRGTSSAGRGTDELEMLYSPPPCQADYLPREEEIVPGVEVFTSGLGGVFPEGLLVGRVVASSLDTSRLYRRATVAPSADLRNLSYVFVCSEQRRENVHPRRKPADADAGAQSASKQGWRL